MPAVRLSMRKVKEVLRLKFEGGQTNHRIARSCHINRPTVADYLLRFEEAGLQWPAAGELDDTTLDRKLFAPTAAAPLARLPQLGGMGEPNWLIN